MYLWPSPLPKQAKTEKTSELIFLGADFIGLVFAESRRKVSIEKAREISEAIKKWRQNSERSLERTIEEVPSVPSTQWYKERSQDLLQAVNKSRPLLVGVFANNELEFIKQVVEEVGLDIVQLSGNEALDSGKDIPVPVWKALHVPSGPDSVSALEDKIAPSVGYNSALLLDTQDATALGGTGRAFDWKIACSLTEKSHSFFLAGGLNPENVLAAVSAVKPFGVDVSSGVESAPGVKSLESIKKFILNAKSLN
jgi:anthranilate synthase/indole-3-glycerol phosphate synthase/phosphoribosylanthranilate isomerase